MSKRFNLREFQQGLLDRMQVQAEGGSQVATLGIVIGQKYNFNAGLLVSKVMGLRNSTDWQRSEQDGNEFYQDENGQQWQKLDIGRLLQQPEFIQIGI